MIIVIDLSRKLVGYNLFQSFFYDLKSQGTLVFANNPLTVDDKGMWNETINHEEDIELEYREKDEDRKIVNSCYFINFSSNRVGSEAYTQLGVHV